jgi:hypothetical protein
LVNAITKNKVKRIRNKIHTTGGVEGVQKKYVPMMTVIDEQIEEVNPTVIGNIADKKALPMV